MLSGDNGILQRATDAKTKNVEAQIKERIQLAYHSALAGGQGSYTKESLENELEKEFGDDYEVDDSDNNNWILKAGGQNVTIPAGIVMPPSTKFPAYTIGQTVTIAGETFYVIENSDENKSTVKLLSALNINTSTNKQDENADRVAFDDETNIYENSSIKQLVDLYVSSLGIDVQEGRLMKLDEAEALGCNSTEYSSSEAPSFINTSIYWLYSAYDTEISVWDIYGFDEELNYDECNMNRFCGVRPVIVVLKSNIQ